MLNISAEQIVKKLDLKPHPEGGYFKEVYRSDEQLSNLPNRFKGNRNIATSIYFMLNQHDISHFHKIESDETWHYYFGASVKIHMIDLNGNYSNKIIGGDFLNGENFQFTVPKQVWFASEIINKSSFGLFGCTVAPGFDFVDFKLAKTHELLKLCPSQKEIIKRFCID